MSSTKLNTDSVTKPNWTDEYMMRSARDCAHVFMKVGMGPINKYSSMAASGNSANTNKPK